MWNEPKTIGHLWIWAGSSVYLGARPLINRRSNAGFEQLGELLGRDRLAEIVPLRFITLVRLKKGQLFSRFHALSHHPQVKTSPHTDDRSHYGRFMGGIGDLTDERLVDLEGID